MASSSSPLIEGRKKFWNRSQEAIKLHDKAPISWYLCNSMAYLCGVAEVTKMTTCGLFSCNQHTHNLVPRQPSTMCRTPTRKYYATAGLATSKMCSRYLKLLILYILVRSTSPIRLDPRCIVYRFWLVRHGRVCLGRKREHARGPMKQVVASTTATRLKIGLLSICLLKFTLVFQSFASQVRV